MSVRRVVLKNVAWNWGGMSVEAAAAFVVTPFLVNRLGDTVYGLWILIGSLSSYFGLLDLGVRGSVGRYAAFHRAKGDRGGVNRTVSTAFAISTAVGLFVLGCTAGVVWIFFGSFEVPPDQAAGVRAALILICVNLALTFPLSTFDGTLWAAQRFDLLNAVDVPATFARVLLTYYAVDRGYGLVGLAVATLVVTAGTGAVKCFLSLYEDPGLRISAAHVSPGTVRELFGYGLLNFVITMARMTRAQMSPFLIGSLMGLSLVTVYTVAKRLFDYAEKVVWSATGVVAPLATTLHATERHDRQRAMFEEGGRYCMAVALFFLIAFSCLGRPFILLWIGPRLAHASVLLVILTAGEVLPMSQCITGSILFGVGRLRVLAYLCVGELVFGLPMAAAVAGRWGLVGVCVVLAASAASFRGILLLIHGCRTTGEPVMRYLSRALLPPLVLGGIPYAALAGAVSWHTPDNWPLFVVYSLCFAFMYALFCIPLVDRNRLAVFTLAFRRAISGKTAVGNTVD